MCFIYIYVLLAFKNARPVISQRTKNLCVDDASAHDMGRVKHDEEKALCTIILLVKKLYLESILSPQMHVSSI